MRGLPHIDASGTGAPIKHRPYLHEATADAAWNSTDGRWDATARKTKIDGTLDAVAVTLPVVSPEGRARVLEGERLVVVIDGDGLRAFAPFDTPRMAHDVYFEGGACKVWNPEVMASVAAIGFSMRETPQTVAIDDTTPFAIWVRVRMLSTFPTLEIIKTANRATAPDAPEDSSMASGGVSYCIAVVTFNDADEPMIEQVHRGVKHVEFPTYQLDSSSTAPETGAAFYVAADSGTRYGLAAFTLAEIEVVTDVDFVTPGTTKTTIEYLKRVDWPI